MSRYRSACVLVLLLGSAASQAQPCTPHLLGADRRGPAAAISRTGSTLYVGAGAALLVVDATDRANPIERGFVNLDSVVRDVAAAGATAVILAGSTLVFVDTSDPDEPVITGSWPIPAAWNVRSVDARGTLAYLPASDGLHIVDFSDPSEADPVGYLATLDAGDVATRSSTRAYIVGNDVLHVLDISTPSAPSVVSSTALSNGADAAVAIGPNGGRLATWRTHSSHHPWSDIALFDLSNPDVPVLRWTGESDPIAALTIAGDRAYIGASIFGISNLAQPVWLGQLSQESPRAHATTGDPDLLYVADWYTGVATMDVSTPSAVVRIDVVQLPTPTVDGYVMGTNAVLLENYGLRVVGLEDPTRPNLVGDLRLQQDYLWGITRIGPRAVLSGSWHDDPEWNRLVDLGDPATPALEESLPGLDFGPHLVDGQVLYAFSDCARELILFDLAQPGTPQPLASIDVMDCYGPVVAVDGGRLYLRHMAPVGPEPSPVISTFDVSDPSAPVELASVADVLPQGRSAARGRYLVQVRSSRDFVDLLDLSLPTSPVVRGSVPLSHLVGTDPPALYGSRAGLRRAVLGLGYGASLVDTTDASEPFEWGWIATPGSADGIFFGPGIVVVADGYAGYSIFESCIPFADGFESGDTSEWSLLAP